MKYELDLLEKPDTISSMGVTKTNTLPLITEKDQDEDGQIITGVKRSRTFDLFSGKRESHDGGTRDDKPVVVGVQRRGTMTDA